MKKLLIICAVLGFVFSFGNMAMAAKWEVPGDYDTIQDAVDLASDGDVIRVAAGVYETQVSIVDKNIKLIGAVGATLKAPENMELSINYNGKDNYAIIFVQDANVTIKGFKVDGAGRGNSNYRFVGIRYRSVFTIIWRYQTVLKSRVKFFWQYLEVIGKGIDNIQSAPPFSRFDSTNGPQALTCSFGQLGL